MADNRTVVMSVSYWPLLQFLEDNLWRKRHNHLCIPENPQNPLALEKGDTPGLIFSADIE